MTESGTRRPPHRSKTFGILGILSVVGVACGPTAPSSQGVTVYVPSCPDPAPLASASAAYIATGDFSPFVESTSSMSATGVDLGLPASTRSIEVDVAAWAGVTLVPSAGPVNVLTLESDQDCHLSSQLVSTPPASGPGESMGLASPGQALVIGGTGGGTTTFVIDLGTGKVSPATPSAIPRNGASVTPYGTGALVAGGQSIANGQIRDDAEVYVPAEGGGGGFSPGPDLQSSRELHGAVALSTGETLLIGGTADGTTPLGTMESIAVGATSSTMLGVKLVTARKQPTVLLLPTGQVFVGGGFDASDKPISTVEWLDGNLDVLEAGTSPPASQTLCMTDSVQAFAPLEGGAVMAVFGGTPPPGCSNVLILRAGLPPGLAAPLRPPPTSPMLLFRGARGQPVLVSRGMVQRWGADSDTWQDAWTAFPSTTLYSNPVLTALSADPGLALWVAEDSFVHAMRFDTRNIYATDTQTFFGSDAVVVPWAPDRLFSQCTCACPAPDVSFSPASGLSLQCGASVFLTDATFLDFSMTFTTPLKTPSLVMRDNDTGVEFVVDVARCVEGDAGDFLNSTLQVQRSGSTVRAGIETDQGTTLSACPGVMPAAQERVAIGFRAPNAGSGTLSDVTIERAP